jgi:hypothetical protein
VIEPWGFSEFLIGGFHKLLGFSNGFPFSTVISELLIFSMIFDTFFSDIFFEIEPASQKVQTHFS